MLGDSSRLYSVWNVRFYAVGSFDNAIGDMFGISKSLVESIICEVSFLISTKLRNQFIVMPET